MEAQLDLLADTPRSRMADPVTSHVAAEEIKETRELQEQQLKVLEFVRNFPGLTSAELAEKMADNYDNNPELWHRYRAMFGRRLSELKPVYVMEGAKRKCWVTGTGTSKRECLTYYPTQKGRTYLLGGHSN